MNLDSYIKVGQMTEVELVIAIIAAIIIFGLLFKILRWAVEAAVFFTVLAVGLYVAISIVGIGEINRFFIEIFK